MEEEYFEAAAKALTLAWPAADFLEEELLVDSRLVLLVQEQRVHKRRSAVGVLFARLDHSDVMAHGESTEARSPADWSAIVVEKFAAFHFDKQVVQAALEGVLVGFGQTADMYYCCSPRSSAEVLDLTLKLDGEEEAAAAGMARSTGQFEAVDITILVSCLYQCFKGHHTGNGGGGGPCATC